MSEPQRIDEIERRLESGAYNVLDAPDIRVLLTAYRTLQSEHARLTAARDEARGQERELAYANEQAEEDRRNAEATAGRLLVKLEAAEVALRTSQDEAWANWQSFKKAEARLAELRAAQGRLITKLRAASGQLRHAYWLLQNTRVESQHTFAEGLIAPQIRRIEECADDLAALAGDGGSPPSADAVDPQDGNTPA